MLERIYRVGIYRLGFIGYLPISRFLLHRRRYILKGAIIWKSIHHSYHSLCIFITTFEPTCFFSQFACTKRKLLNLNAKFFQNFIQFRALQRCIKYPSLFQRLCQFFFNPNLILRSKLQSRLRNEDISIKISFVPFRVCVPLKGNKKKNRVPFGNEYFQLMKKIAFH